MTNYEWIKSMSVDELAALLDSISGCSRCRKRGNSCFPMSMDDWLEREHEVTESKEIKGE